MNEVIETWFQLRDQMLVEGKTPTGARPPSLRDACYAYALANRTMIDTNPATIEAFVNGLELGALGALRLAWNFKQEVWRTTSAPSDHRA